MRLQAIIKLQQTQNSFSKENREIERKEHPEKKILTFPK